MSQAKVDRYKEEKRNREKIMKKEKREIFLMKLAGTVIAIALVGWIGFSVYQNVTGDVAHTYQVKTEAFDDYLNGMNAETEAEGTETEAGETEAETSAEETSEPAETESAAE